MITACGPDNAKCECCGDAATTFIGRTEAGGHRHARCRKHGDRNPCVIEGCLRTHDRGTLYGNDQWICGDHWRRFVPPRSPLRRAYHMFWRTAKKHGWTPELRIRYWRFWDGLVARVRRDAQDGSIDQTEIARLFGWSDEA